MYYTVYDFRVFASKLSWNMNLVKRWKLFKVFHYTETYTF